VALAPLKPSNSDRPGFETPGSLGLWDLLGSRWRYCCFVTGKLRAQSFKALIEPFVAVQL